LGPCNVTADLKTQVNPYAWNEVSNLLFLSQPVGVGFSYSEELVGTINDTTGYPTNTSGLPPDGRYSVVDEFAIDTTDLAAVGTWHVLQGFLANLPHLDPTIKSRKFNLWTESYGGHYGPGMYSL
jgi:carboxypeptidase C (cathepsin A)